MPEVYENSEKDLSKFLFFSIEWYVGDTKIINYSNYEWNNSI